MVDEELDGLVGPHVLDAGLGREPDEDVDLRARRIRDDPNVAQLAARRTDVLRKHARAETEFSLRLTAGLHRQLVTRTSLDLLPARVCGQNRPTRHTSIGDRDELESDADRQILCQRRAAADEHQDLRP